MKTDLQPSKGILELGTSFRGAETAVSWWSLRVKGRPKTPGHAPCIYPLPFIFGALSIPLTAGRESHQPVCFRTHDNTQTSRGSLDLNTTPSKHTPPNTHTHTHCKLGNPKATEVMELSKAPLSSLSPPRANNFLLRDVGSH